MTSNTKKYSKQTLDNFSVKNASRFCIFGKISQKKVYGRRQKIIRWFPN